MTNKIEAIGVDRFEVIGPEGREYVRYLKPNEELSYMFQDDGSTIKFFIEQKGQDDES